MSEQQGDSKRQLLEIAGDGGVATAAIFAGLTAAMFGLAALTGGNDLPTWVALLSGLVSLASGIGGPVLAWRLHGRRINQPAVIGALLAFPITGVVFFVFVGISQALGWALRSVNDAEWFGPLIAASLLTAVIVAFVVWLLVDAVKDMRGSRQHKNVDTLRVASAVVILAFIAIVIVVALVHDGEAVEALAFMLMGGVAGAMMLASAEVANRILGRKPSDSTPAAV